MPTTHDDPLELLRLCTGRSAPTPDAIRARLKPIDTVPLDNAMAGIARIKAQYAKDGIVIDSALRRLNGERA